MTTKIVTINTSITTAALPNQLQQRGAFVTQGGTTLTPGTTATLTGSGTDLSSIAAPPVVNTSLAWSGGVVTVTTATPHGWPNAEQIKITVAGVAPAAYNGTYVATITGASTYTYALTSNPGAETTPGTSTLWAVAELQQMYNTYFAGSGVRAVSVLELGVGIAVDGIAELAAFITSVLGTSDAYYSYLVPREWDNVTEYLTLARAYEAPDKELYFFTTTTLTNRAVYAAIKSVFALVESPDIDNNEFSCAAPFGTTLKQNPSNTNKVPPLSYTPCFGTTPYPVRGNQAELSELADANVNWIGTGAEGGVSTDILFQGKMSDGNFWNFWYSVDWAQINMDLALANEVINGSATSLNPLYYNQKGIDRLQNRAGRVAQQGIGYGLGNGQVLLTKLSSEQFQENYNAGLYAGKIVINAVPFATYAAANPGDYGIGKYAGISCIWIPQLPFLNIFFDLNATTLITG